MTTEVLGEDRPGASRRLRLVGAAVTVLLAVGWTGSAFLTHRGDSELRRCVQVAEEDLVDLQQRAAGLEQYVGPQLRSPTVSLPLQRSLAQIVQQSVARDLPRTRRDRTRCAQVRVLPWHAEVARARSSYLVWLDLRIRELSDVARDLDALHAARPEVAAARARAEQALAERGIRLSP